MVPQFDQTQIRTDLTLHLMMPEQAANHFSMLSVISNVRPSARLT